MNFDRFLRDEQLDSDVAVAGCRPVPAAAGRFTAAARNTVDRDGADLGGK